MNSAIVAVACALGVALAPSPQSPGGAHAAVVKLYRDFAWEVVSDDPGLSMLDLFGRPRAELARYLDDNLVALVMKDRDCSARTKEVCNLDFSPIWDSQDPVGTTVLIKPTGDSTRVAVTLTYRGEAKKNTLTYVLAKTPAGWRVHDIRYQLHESLVTMLSAKHK